MSADGSLVLSVGSSKERKSKTEEPRLNRRSEAVVNVRLLRLDNLEIARNLTALKASLAARGIRAALTAIMPRAQAPDMEAKEQ